MTRPTDTAEALVCFACAEPIEVDDDALNTGDSWLHRDCLVRSVVGGVNHQRGSCTCCGGDQPPDPPSLSRREAARVAAKFHYRRLVATRR